MGHNNYSNPQPTTRWQASHKSTTTFSLFFSM